jgi:hypothetical protein
MIAINCNIITEGYLEDQQNIDDIIASKKGRVLNLIQNPFTNVNGVREDFNDHQIEYLELLHDDFEQIVLADNELLHELKDDFDVIISGDQMLLPRNKKFRERLIKALDYKTLRDDFFPSFYEQIGIKSCVYCNSQLAVTVRKIDGARTARFQFDHYFSKSMYPCFSITFQNLYPACGPCNISKKNNSDINFRLYSDDYHDYRTSQFSFRIDLVSLLRYRLNGDKKRIEIIFNEPDNTGFENVFGIHSIYNTQKDIAEELILKSMIYNEDLSKSLVEALNRLYGDKKPMLGRLITGYYTDEKDIHKRPLSKFTMDIARQLKLI